MQKGLLYKYCKTHDKITANIAIAIHFIFALGIFIIPSDILSNYPVCAKFVIFMKQYFPNIQIFSDVSPFKQEIEFYTSYMWIPGMIWAAETAFFVFCQSFIFMSTDARAQKVVKEMNLAWIIFGLTFGYFAMKVYFTGYIVTDGVTLFARDFDVRFESKFEIFLVIFFFQTAFPTVGVGCFLISLFTLAVKIFNDTK